MSVCSGTPNSADVKRRGVCWLRRPRGFKRLRSRARRIPFSTAISRAVIPQGKPPQGQRRSYWLNWRWGNPAQRPAEGLVSWRRQLYGYLFFVFRFFAPVQRQISETCYLGTGGGCARGVQVLGTVGRWGRFATIESEERERGWNSIRTLESGFGRLLRVYEGFNCGTASERHVP